MIINDIDRDAKGICCPKCKGYCEILDVTDKEDVKYGCGRYRCCARKFQCLVCKEIYFGKAEAPELDYD